MKPKDSIYLKFSQRMKILRYDNRLTQKELSDNISVPLQTIINWEQGKSIPEIHTLIYISELFSVTLDFLFGYDRRYATYQNELFSITCPPGYDDIEKIVDGKYGRKRAVRKENVEYNSVKTFLEVLNIGGLFDIMREDDSLIVNKSFIMSCGLRTIRITGYTLNPIDLLIEKGLITDLKTVSYKLSPILVGSVLELVETELRFSKSSKEYMDSQIKQINILYKTLCIKKRKNLIFL